MKRMWLCVFSLCLLAGSAAAQSQITTGVIQGSVVDASGGVVPGADVEAKNLDTNITRSATTDADGRFAFLALQPGRYSVTIKKQGFATVVHESINLTVGQTVSLSPSLKVSAATEVITVTDVATVETTKTEVSTTLNDKTVANTPVLGRKFEDLLTLTPGVSIVQGPDGDEITFTGQRGIFTNFSLDGGDYINGFFGEQVGGQRAAIDIPLDAVKEFQVVASGARAEFGRTAGGVVNVISRSGTNDFHGSFYHFQRHENLSSNTSDGKPLTDFHREQFGATAGGPIVEDKAFFFFAVERITGNLQRDNLSAPLGAACANATPLITNPADEALINASAECQRVALLNFFRTSTALSGPQEEGLPVRRPLWTTSPFFKLDWNVTPSNIFNFSYSFNASKKVNETFDVATYGNSANGIEGDFTKINVLNFNLVTTVSNNKVNEAHFTYSREVRPRSAVASNVPADTAMGFATTFRFGQPFFLNPTVDETFWRTQMRDNFSWIAGRHQVKFGGEWIHSLNDQIFRGFFQGRYIFDSVPSFLRYASPAAAGGFGPNTAECQDSTTGAISYVTIPTACPAGSAFNGGPLLLFLQGAGPSGPATDAAGASKIDNEEFAFFIQDQWQIRSNLTLNYGLRWEAQIFPETVDPATTAYGFALSNPAFPSDGTLHSDKRMWQPRLGLAWDMRSNQKSVFRANAGIYNARQNMLSQVGSVTTNGIQQQTIFVNTGLLTSFGVPTPTWPGLVTPAASTCGTNPFPCFSGVRVFHRDYRNPRVYTANFAFEQEIAPDWSVYTDFTWSKGVYLTRFINFNRNELGNLFGPNLGEVFTTTSFGQSLYRGWTIGMRKRFSHKYQLEWNYVLSGDYDDDSNERDPFTDRAFGTGVLNSGLPARADYGFSDRDIRHKFNFYTYAELPWAFELNVRMQGRSAQPCSPGQTPAAPCAGVRAAGNRNTLRKDTKFFSFDWRLQRVFRFKERYALTPIIEMFNTFNNDNNINPLVTPGLFDFSGFLRQGVGDPRQVQVAFKFTW